MELFIQNNIIPLYDENIFQIFLLNKPAKIELHDILLKKNMDYEKNVLNVNNEKLQIPYSLTTPLFLKMAIILNVKSAVLLAKRNKER